MNNEPVGIKLDHGKLRWDLLRAGCPLALEEVIRVLMFGAQKYDDHNWKLVEDGEKRYRNALDRHLAELDKGIPLDAETGLSHLAHVATNALFLLELAMAERPSPLPNPVAVAK